MASDVTDSEFRQSVYWLDVLLFTVLAVAVLVAPLLAVAPVMYLTGLWQLWPSCGTDACGTAQDAAVNVWFVLVFGAWLIGVILARYRRQPMYVMLLVPTGWIAGAVVTFLIPAFTN